MGNFFTNRDSLKSHEVVFQHNISLVEVRINSKNDISRNDEINKKIRKGPDKGPFGI